ncbi:hypothetical protein Goshw_018621 [Gossypium schwendimanii]|uniref:Uncharacterized protein n=1 Tax=Gossypium schwendimanii TaxID=34291 RepID=A0A7J9LGS2_GOSSC|nr:hypothetical protein [Gossypium schwendimanii]
MSFSGTLPTNAAKGHDL